MKWPIYLTIILLWSESILGASELPLVAGNFETIQQNYLKMQKEYSKELCLAGDEQKFEKLYQKYKGSGHYVPFLKNDEIDLVTIKKFMPVLNEKLKWIKTEQGKLKKIKSWGKLKSKLKNFESEFKALLLLKKNYFFSHYGQKEDKLSKKELALSNKDLIHFKKEFDKLFNQLSFLKGFRYPVDHLKWRKKYDWAKTKKKENLLKLKNSLFFYRKIIEDGAMDLDHRRGDFNFRTTLNTTKLTLDKTENFLSENLRYDISYLIKNLEITIGGKKQVQLNRLKEWEKRITDQIKFYKNLLNNSKTKGQFIEERKKATIDLQNFVFDKFGKVYEYWSQKDEIYRALFVLETILFNEVGNVDVLEGTERRDVIQVVLNRFYLERYQLIPKNSELLKRLGSEVKKKLKSLVWTNLMFKRGEFSFTYYFIPSVVRVFCPEMTNSGMALRKKNISLSLAGLKSPNLFFKPTRYFSRESMTGRINMGEVWKGYRPMAERPGEKIKDQGELLKNYRSDQFEFFYDFDGADGRKYLVLSMQERIFTFDIVDKVFYAYRNPHHFTFFERIE